MSRSGHSACQYKDCMLVFGGIHEVTQELDDLVIFDFKNKRWINLFEVQISPGLGGTHQPPTATNNNSNTHIYLIIYISFAGPVNRSRASILKQSSARGSPKRGGGARSDSFTLYPPSPSNANKSLFSQQKPAGGGNMMNISILDDGGGSPVNARGKTS
jgi:hypothetical protein